MREHPAAEKAATGPADVMDISLNDHYTPNTKKVKHPTRARVRRELPWPGIGRKSSGAVDPLARGRVNPLAR
jgi:hypothetical protein